jgi:cysteine desulfurase
MTQRVYLDHNATVPIRPEVLDTMSEVLQIGGNASSVHAEGRKARQFLEVAREQIALFVDGEAGGVIFTGGGTEACNLALQTRKAPAGNITRIIVSSIEHAAVLAPLDDLAEYPNITVTHLPVSGQGIVDLNALSLALEDPSPALVVVMAANNETGVVQPIGEIGAMVRAHGSLFFCDAIQAAGKIPLSMKDMNIDILSLSAHKIGGAAGVGALVVRDGVVLNPLIRGGGQELRRRAGTENLAGCVGFGLAARLAKKGLSSYSNLSTLRDDLESQLVAAFPEISIFAESVERLPNTSCFALPDMRSETMIMSLDLSGIAVSSGAACSSGKVTRSHVLEAMGVQHNLLEGAIRISFGQTNTASDINHLISALKGHVDLSQPQLQSANRM